MMYIVWALLNISLYCFFLFVCFTATKLIKEKFGIFTALIFVVGLLSFISHSDNNYDNRDQSSNRVKTWEFNSFDSLDKVSNAFIYTDLEKTPISKYVLGISYGKGKQLKYNIPVKAISVTTGIVSGTSWKPLSIIINRTDDNNKFEYQVDGTVDWSLLGITFYSQSRHWKGYTIIK